MDLLGTQTFTATAGAATSGFVQLVPPPGKKLNVHFIIVDLTAFKTACVAKCSIFLTRNNSLDFGITQLAQEFDTGGHDYAFIYDRPFQVDKVLWIGVRVTSADSGNRSVTFTVAGEVE